MCSQGSARAQSRLTGGEPLLRRNVEHLVQMLAAIPALDVALTTNGALLAQKAHALAHAGLKRVNVSLDSVDDAIFRALNDVDFPVERVLEGIDAAVEAGLRVKVNAVVKRGVNDEGIVALAERFRGRGIPVRFIEYMDVGQTNGGGSTTLSPRTRSSAASPRCGPSTRSPPVPASARRYRYGDGAGEIGVIASVTKPFCDGCSRARLSAEGGCTRASSPRLALASLCALQPGHHGRRLPRRRRGRQRRRRRRAAAAGRDRLRADAGAARRRLAAAAAAARAARQRRRPREPDRARRSGRTATPGFIIMEPTEYPAMSGSNTICVATVLLETGMVEMREPETTLRLEAPAGVVEVRRGCRDGRCESVELTNVPCFADRLDAPLEVDGLGTLTVDVAFGGMWYAIADARGARLRARAVGGARALARRRADPRAPRASSCRACTRRTRRSPGVSIVQIAEPWRASARSRRTPSSSRPGRLDRSATGTGLSRAHGGAARARADAASATR